MLHGKGKKIWVDGSVYEGQFVNGKAEGTGRFIDSKNGFIYMGNWQNDKTNGQGTLTQVNGATY